MVWVVSDSYLMDVEEAVSISAVGAVAYVCCTITFVLLVCLLFFLGLTPTQRYKHCIIQGKNSS